MIHLSNNPDRPYLLDVDFRYDPNLVAIIKQIPGAVWDKTRRVWNIAIDFSALFINVCQLKGYQITAPQSASLVFGHVNRKSYLATQFEKGYQHESVISALSDPTGHIFNFKPGLGKTAAAIETLRLGDHKLCLIICPAMVRRTWENEFKKWWPACEPDKSVFIISEGPRKTPSKAARETLERLHGRLSKRAPGTESNEPTFIVTSYGLLSKLQEIIPTVHFDAIVFDEIHALQDPKTKQYKEAEALVQAHFKAKRYGLTGTIMTNGIIGAWGPLNIIWPGRFGTRFNFGERYTNAEQGQYGWTFEGVNEANVEELKTRLALVSTQATEKDAVGNLPTLSIEEIDEVGSDGSIFDLSAWADLILSSGDARLAVLGYNRDKVKENAIKLQKICPAVWEISGEEVAEKRAKSLQEMLDYPADKPAIVSATISSIKIGINAFANFPVVLFTDLSHNLEEMTQAILRFRRKGSNISRVRGYMLTNAITKPKAFNLRKKIAAINAVLKVGAAESSLEDAFKQQNEYSEQEWQDALKAVMNSYTGDESD